MGGLAPDALLLRRSADADITFDLLDTQNAPQLAESLHKHGVTHIIHTAAVTPWSGNQDYAQDIAMADTLSRVCNELKIDTLIFMSGWNVYDMTQGNAPFSEDTPLGSDNDYGTSKLAAEQFLKDNLQHTKLINARLASIYGPGQLSAGLIPNTVSAALSGQDIRLNSISTRRDYLYIDDLVTAIEKLVTNTLDSSADINIGSGASVSVGEFAQLVPEVYQEVSGNMVTNVPPENPIESPLIDNQLDISKAQSLGLLQNVTPFKTGLKRYIQWKLEQ